MRRRVEIPSRVLVYWYWYWPTGTGLRPLELRELTKAVVAVATVVGAYGWLECSVALRVPVHGDEKWLAKVV